MLGTGRAAAPGGAGDCKDLACANQPREVEDAGAVDDWAAAGQPRGVESAAAETGEEVGRAPREVQGPTPPWLAAGREAGAAALGRTRLAVVEVHLGTGGPGACPVATISALNR